MEERIDSLHVSNLRIIQAKEAFCFGIDAVLLADLGYKYLEKDLGLKKLKVTDLCSGNGIIPLLLTGKTPFELRKNLSVCGVEVQTDIARMAERSVKLNDLESFITIFNGDLKDAANPDFFFFLESQDLVLVNPPYMIPSKGRQSSNKLKMIARQEILCNLKDVLKSAEVLLKKDGRFVMIHRYERLDEILLETEKTGFSEIEYTLVRPFENQEPSLVLVSALKKEKPEHQKPCKKDDLIIYSTQGEYTEEVKKIYGRE